MYLYILLYNWHILVCTRLSSSTELLITPIQGPACTVYHMFLTPATRWLRFSWLRGKGWLEFRESTQYWCITVHTSIYKYILICTGMYLYKLCFLCSMPTLRFKFQVENIKTVANLSNNKAVFMCILRFHACAGYFQHY
jgi:hypothetical protein